jgi:hypothetical protein
MERQADMKRKVLPAGAMLLLALFLANCRPFFRYRTAACKQREAALSTRVETLRRDARERLRVGTRKDAVIRFFAENGIPVEFVRDKAIGTIAIGTIVTKGCAPASCSDEVTLHLSVKVDASGTVTSEPVVDAMYTDCM